MNKEKAKKRIRRVTAAAAALALAVSITFPAGTDMSGISFGNAIVAAADTYREGTFGTDLKWVLDTDGELTISYTGTGDGEAMPEWVPTNTGSIPWYNYRKDIKSVVIKDKVTSIGGYAFSYCSNLTNVTIAGSVKSIGDKAFKSCTNLESITIPDSVTSIGSSAFDYCKNLISITIPDSVTSIGSSAFDSCTSLESITIPDSVTSIGNYAFRNCSSLERVEFGANPQLTSIGKEAFYNCTSLDSITIPDSVDYIGEEAFSGCTSLDSITIPDSVTSIGNYAFMNCESLTSINIPALVTSIGRMAFSYCSSLDSFIVDQGNTNYSSQDGVLFDKNKTTLIFYPANKEGAPYIIPDSVTSIGSYAFTGCLSITSVTIPAGVTDIQSGAFYRCSSLESFIVDEGNTNYSSQDGVLFDKNKTTLIYYPISKEGTSYVIPDTVNSFAESCFVFCSNLQSVIIPDSVNSIGESAFWYCTNLQSIILPNSVTSIVDWAFDACTNLESIILPAGASIGYDAIPNTATQLKYTVEDGTVKITEVTTGYYRTYVAIPETIDGMPVIINDGVDFGTLTQIKYTVSDGKVKVTGVTLGSGQTTFTIPLVIGGYPVTAVVEDCREYVDNHTCTGGTATCIAKAVCGLCGNEYGELLPHSFTNYIPDEGGLTETAECDYGCGTTDTRDIAQEPDDEDPDDEDPDEPTDEEHVCTPSTSYYSDENAHWHICTECGEQLDYEAHISDGGKVTKQATSYCEGVITYSCTVCGRVLKTEIIPMKIDPVVMGAFANSYIYSYDSDMNKITMNKTRKPGVITVDLGKKYAGKSFTVYNGKNSTEDIVYEGTLDENGRAVITVDNGRNYTLVIS